VVVCFFGGSFFLFSFVVEIEVEVEVARERASKEREGERGFFFLSSASLLPVLFLSFNSWVLFLICKQKQKNKKRVK